MRIGLLAKMAGPSLRQFVAEDVSPRITTKKLDTPHDSADTNLSSVAEDAVMITQDFRDTGNARAARQRMDALQKSEPDAVQTLMQLTEKFAPVGYEKGPENTFKLDLAKPDSLDDPFASLYIDTTPSAPGVEVVSVLHRATHLALD